ncbi:MAG TPA: choice-of-anchor tandem repeat GloVer-containing protein, partial [Puia sp.]|nr:choice-of-anchor tandem repeat GloVer-containing protein [Puia sp.]
MKQFQALLIAIMALSAASAQSPTSATFKLLYTFPGGSSGAAAPTNLHEVSPGLFYGSTAGVNQTMGGEIFFITSGGTYHGVFQFPGLREADWVMPAENGKLFGSKSQGGNYPSYFTIKPNGTELQEHPAGAFGTTFTGYPYTIPAQDGKFYTASGASRTALSIVKIDLDGTITTVHAFSGSEGQPVIGASLLRGGDGSFYGINALPNNGSSDAWVYRLTPEGQFTVLATFPVLGIGPSPPLVLAPNGTLYGATFRGGSNLAGQIYMIPPNGPLTILATFPANGGMFGPTSLFMADDGNLYGTTLSSPSYFFR